jgi:peptidoglycan/LPS O-acetylase OafA/YrhL
MKSTKIHADPRILNAIYEFLLLSLLSLLVPVVVATDIQFFTTGFSEIPLTEISQELLLGMSAILFARNAYQQPASRGFLTLVAGMFLTMLIRELDGYLDRWVYHSFWVWPAGLVVLSTVTYVTMKCSDTIWQPMSRFVGTRSHSCIMLGLVILLVLSRSLGSGDLLWRHVMEKEQFNLMFKTALQEGLELFGYIFVFYGSWLYPRSNSGSPQDPV